MNIVTICRITISAFPGDKQSNRAGSVSPSILPVVHCLVEKFVIKLLGEREFVTYDSGRGSDAALDIVYGLVLQSRMVRTRFLVISNLLI